MCKLQSLLIVLVWLCPADTSRSRQVSRRPRHAQPKSSGSSFALRTETSPSSPDNQERLAWPWKRTPWKRRVARAHVTSKKKKKQFIIGNLAGLAGSNPLGLAGQGGIFANGMGLSPANYGAGLATNGNYGNGGSYGNGGNYGNSLGLEAAGASSSYPALKSTTDYTAGAMGLGSLGSYGNGLQSLSSPSALDLAGNSLNSAAMESAAQVPNTQSILGAGTSNGLLGASETGMLGGGLGGGLGALQSTGLGQTSDQEVMASNNLYNVDQSMAGKVNMEGVGKLEGTGRQGIGSSLNGLGLDGATMNELGELGVGGGGGDLGTNNGYQDSSLQQILGKLLLGTNGMDGQLGGDQLGGQLGGQMGMENQLSTHLGQHTNGQLAGQMDGQLAGQMDGQLAGQMDGHAEGHGAEGAAGGYGSQAGSLAGINALLAAAGHYGQADDNSEASEDAQPSSDADEQVLPGFMHRPMNIAPIVPGHTVHIHASDKPRISPDTPSLSTPAANALKVQLQANSEHEKKLRNLKLKLKNLREKLMRLKDEYKDSDDINEKSDLEKSQKSEMETLKDLKKAAEEAIDELKLETGNLKHGGSKKLIFIHKYTGGGNKMKASDLESLSSDLIALIEPGKDKPSARQAKNGRQSSSKGQPQDDTSALTELAKEAEEEVDRLTSGKGRNRPSKQPSATQKPAIQSTIIGGSLSTPQVAPVQGASEQRAPEEWPPVQGASLQGASVQRAPEEGPSVQGASVQRAPEEGPSVQGVSRQGASVQGTSEEGSPVQGASLQGTSEQGAPKSLPGTAPRPKPAHAGLRRPLNSVQLNNLAQILPEPEESERHKTPRAPSSPPANISSMLKDMGGGKAPGYFSIGCWRDQPERALSSLEGIFKTLDGNDYKKRKFAIKKCSVVARQQGFPAFALENGGHCLAGKNILQTYNMYGPAGACKQDGRGGPWSMEVYKFTVPPSANRRRTRIFQRKQARLRGLHLVAI